MSRTRLLAFSGGGLRGYLSALILRDMEKTNPFLSKVDLFSGCSTGALIACGLASGKLSTDDLVTLYRSKGPKIFELTALDQIKSVFGLYTARYNPKNLKSMLEDIFGTMKLGDLARPVLIPAMDLGSKDRPYRAKFFDNFKANSIDREVLVVDVCLASAAAPTYFPTHRIRLGSLGDRDYADGGLFCNHTSVSSICSAIDIMGLGAKLSDVACLGIGTGSFNENASGWVKRGAIGWYEDVIDLATEQASTVVYQAERLLTNRFHFINPLFPSKIKLDSKDAIDRIDSNYPDFAAYLKIANDFIAREFVQSTGSSKGLA